MGMFSQTRGVMKMQKRWRAMWEGPSAACSPRPGMDPDRALHNLADLANAGGRTTGDSLVIAMEVVDGVDEYRSFPTAMEDLQQFYKSGELRTTSGHPLRQFASWHSVVELAEAACLLARPVKVPGWVNEQVAAAGRREEHGLARCVELAPLTSLDTYRHWKGVRERTQPGEEDYEEKVGWLDEALVQFKAAAGVSAMPYI